jgi:glycosyltransferase involved in cell wall biosynthesis
LSQLKLQNNTNYQLKKIIVVCDGCTDNTISTVKSFKLPKISIIINRLRLGQSASQNIIFSQTKTDFVIIFEADTIPLSKKYLDILLSTHIKNENIGISQGFPKLLPATTFIGKTLTSQRGLYQKILRYSVKKTNLYCSGRGGRAFSRKVYADLRWPPSVPEDVYALLWCKNRNISCVHIRSAITMYRGVESFTDFLLEVQKNDSGKSALKSYFTNNDVNSIYSRSLSHNFLLFIYFLLKHPISFVTYAFLKLISHVVLQEKLFTDFWLQTKSTKLLFK